VAVQIQYRRGTAAEWSAANPILAVGEPGYETDTGKFKVGNGVNTWSALAYSSGLAGPTGATGSAATIAVGTTTTGAAGSSASVSNSGTSSAAVFEFTIPRGDKGDKGDTGTTGAQGPIGPKSASIVSPTASEKIPLFFTNVALTVAQIRSVIIGGTSATFSIRYGTNISDAGTEVVTSGITCNSTTTGVSTTSFNNASIPADRFVWLTTSAVSGVVNTFHVSLLFS
jgi:hypothetical protein